MLTAATEEPVREKCTAEAADQLTFLAGLDDLVYRTAQACRKWGEYLGHVADSPEVLANAPDDASCRKAAGTRLARLHETARQDVVAERIHLDHGHVRERYALGQRKHVARRRSDVLAETAALIDAEQL